MTYTEIWVFLQKETTWHKNGQESWIVILQKNMSSYPLTLWQNAYFINNQENMNYLQWDTDTHLLEWTIFQKTENTVWVRIRSNE